MLLPQFRVDELEKGMDNFTYANFGEDGEETLESLKKLQRIIAIMKYDVERYLKQ